MNKQQVLGKCDLFKDLDEKQIEVVEKMCTEEEFDAGAEICKQGRKEEKLHVIVDGVAGIILEVGPLTQRQVQSVCQYQVFGWSSMLDPFTCTATVKAIKRTKTLAFNGEKLNGLCLTHPEIGCKIFRGIARVVATRLRETYTQLLGVSGQLT